MYASIVMYLTTESGMPFITFCPFSLVSWPITRSGRDVMKMLFSMTVFSSQYDSTFSRSPVGPTPPKNDIVTKSHRPAEDRYPLVPRLAWHTCWSFGHSCIATPWKSVQFSTTRFFACVAIQPVLRVVDDAVADGDAVRPAGHPAMVRRAVQDDAVGQAVLRAAAIEEIPGSA